MAEGEIILYQPPDGPPEIQLRAHDGTVWLTQVEIADLFQTTVSNINKHIKGILEDGELTEATIEHYSIVQTEGTRQITRTLAHYSLDMILAIGYRVRSPRGTQFRQWATQNLKEYLIKGFVMNDERLKEPGGWDYFDELLERIRQIRASEKRFYQKVRDLFTLSQDYKENTRDVGDFFAEVQNKMLHAVTGHTAAELIVARADSSKPNMNLQSWSGERVRKHDVIVAKNYLDGEEIKTLDRIVTMFLDYAEDRVAQRKQLSLDDWRGNVDRFIQFNERPLLQDKGRIGRDQAHKIAHDRYAEFDASRKRAEAIEADREDLAELEAIEHALEDKTADRESVKKAKKGAE